MKMMKRFLSLLLAVTMACAMGVTALADDSGTDAPVSDGSGSFKPSTPSGGGGSSSSSRVTVTFQTDKDEGTLNGGKEKVLVTISEGSKISDSKIPEVTPVDGKEFVGWIVKGDEDEELIDFDEYKFKKSVTLIAVYEDIEPEDDSLLNKDDHFAYMNGDAGTGTFRPSASLSRAEAATVFYNLLLDQDVKLTASFSDVADTAWYAKQVRTLASLGIITGYTDGTFRPTAPITRAEFATMASKFDDLSKGSITFSDVSESHWAYAYIASAATKGWVGGYPDGTFRPDTKIDRAAVAKIVNAVLGRQADKAFIDANPVRSFTDLTNSHWGYYEIMEAANDHDYKVQDDSEIWTKLA